MADKPLRFLVVGGGITGMAAAHRLQKRLSEMARAFSVVIVESTDRFGGLIATRERDGFMIEEGPDCFFMDKPRGVGLCRDIGLESDLIDPLPAARTLRIALAGKLIRYPQGFEKVAPTDLLSMLLSPTLSLSGKVALLRDFWCPASTQSDETVGAFVRRRFGTETLERLTQPLIVNMVGADPDQISLRATFPKIAEKDRLGSFFKQGMQPNPARTAGAGGREASQVVSFKEGMQTLIQQMGSQMTQIGARLNTSVRLIQGLESGWKAILSSGEELEVDGLCLAVAAPAIATMVMDLDPDLSKLLSKVVYGDSVAVHYAFKSSDIKHKMDDAGFVVPLTEKKALSACTYVHQKFAGRAPAGHALLRAYSAGRAAAALTKLTDREIEVRLLSELRPLLGITGQPLFAHVKRYRQALAQYTPGHQDRMSAVNDHLSVLSGLTLAGNWNAGAELPDCIDSGERAADRLIAELCTNF